MIHGIVYPERKVLIEKLRERFRVSIERRDTYLPLALEEVRALLESLPAAPPPSPVDAQPAAWPEFTYDMAVEMARQLQMIPVADTLVPQEWLPVLKRQYQAASATAAQFAAHPSTQGLI